MITAWTIYEAGVTRARASGPDVAVADNGSSLILLGLPKKEWVQFLRETDVESMSTRELKQAVEQRQEAQKERKQTIAERDQARQESADLCEDLDREKDKNTRLAGERDSLKAENHELTLEKKRLEQKRTGYKTIKQMEATLDEAYGKAEANRIVFFYMKVSSRPLRN